MKKAQGGTWEEEQESMGAFFSSTLELWSELSENRGDALPTFAENSGGSGTAWAQGVLNFQRTSVAEQWRCPQMAGRWHTALGAARWRDLSRLACEHKRQQMPTGETFGGNWGWSKEAEIHNQKKVGINANVTSLTPASQSLKSTKQQLGASGGPRSAL